LIHVDAEVAELLLGLSLDILVFDLPALLAVVDQDDPTFLAQLDPPFQGGGFQRSKFTGAAQIVPAKLEELAFPDDGSGLQVGFPSESVHGLVQNLPGSFLRAAQKIGLTRQRPRNHQQEEGDHPSQGPHAPQHQPLKLRGTHEKSLANA
jgi:hypothetical protein